MSDRVLIGGAFADPPLGGELVDPVLGGGVADQALGGDIGAPQGVAGPPGTDGPPGPPGPVGGNRTYAFPFPAAVTVWSIVHGLARFPSVTVLDTAGDQVLGDLSYLDANTLQVAFSVPVAGVAYLN